MTPPFGFNLFTLKGIVPFEITLADIYRPVIPYTLLELSGMVLIIIFLQIAIKLPTLLPVE